MWKRSLLISNLIAVVLVGAGFALDKTLPVQHLPWRSLNPDAPLGLATKSQLMRLSLSPSKVCMDMAHNSPLLLSVTAEPHKPNKTCGWNIARTVSGAYSTDIVPKEAQMQCPLAIGSYMWTRELNELSEKHFSTGLSKILHVGTYSCRRQNGNNSGEWSEHAFANAWDITGFQLEDGRVISVQKDWSGHDKTRQKFLKDARDKACKIFRVTLSPDFNAAHHDHFHLDMGPSRSCR